MRTFAYDPSHSFRGWLHTVTRNAWLDYLKDQGRPGVKGSGDTGMMRRLGTEEAGADLLGSLAEEFDLELLMEAEAQVQLRVQPRRINTGPPVVS